MSTETNKQLARIIQGYPPIGAAEAILREFVVIPRADLPEVTGDGDSICVEGRRHASTKAPQRRAEALRQLAMAEYLEAEETTWAAAEAEAKRNTRRDELASQFSLTGRRYFTVSNIAQKAIDRIIELEEAQNTP